MSDSEFVTKAISEGYLWKIEGLFGYVVDGKDYNKRLTVADGFCYFMDANSFKPLEYYTIEFFSKNAIRMIPDNGA